MSQEDKEQDLAEVLFSKLLEPMGHSRHYYKSSFKLLNQHSYRSAEWIVEDYWGIEGTKYDSDRAIEWAKFNHFVIAVVESLGKLEDTVKDPYWRWKEDLKVQLEISGVSLSTDASFPPGSFQRGDLLIQRIKYVRCMAKFVETDFNPEIVAERNKALIQMELMQKLDEQGCLKNYLMCNLTER